MAREEKNYDDYVTPAPITDNNEELKNASKKLADQIDENFKNRVQNRMDYMKNTHMRTSFLFDEEIKKKLDLESAKHDRGWKTQFINDALKFAIEGFEARTEEEYR